MAKIGIVTVLYNSASVLEDYFNTLSEQTFKDFVLYVIDNKSPDNSLALSYKYAEQYKDCYKTVIIENDQNYGIAKGNNIGIKKALEDGCIYLLLSNNDVTLEKDTIHNLLSTSQLESASLSIPKIYYFGTNKFWCVGGIFTKKTGSTRHIGLCEDDNGQYDKIMRVEYAPTCFMLLHKNIFDTVGFMDERYFVYFDDTDFLYRCKVAGHNVLYVPNSLVHHKESVSTGKESPFSVFYYNRNILYFNKKNKALVYFIYILLLQLFLCIVYPIRKSGNVNNWKYCWKGFYEGLKLCVK